MRMIVVGLTFYSSSEANSPTTLLVWKGFSIAFTFWFMIVTHHIPVHQIRCRTLFTKAQMYKETAQVSAYVQRHHYHVNILIIHVICTHISIHTLFISIHVVKCKEIIWIKASKWMPSHSEKVIKTSLKWVECILISSAYRSRVL